MEIKEVDLKFRNGMSERTKTKLIIIHHTASTYDMTVQEIHELHLNQNENWKGIGYHYYINKNGIIYRGRPEKYSGSHCEGYNSISIGVCLSGNFEIEEPTIEQLQSLKSLIKYLRKKYTEATIHSHSDFWNTACCGKNLKKYLNNLEKFNFIKVFANNGKFSVIFDNGKKITKQLKNNKDLLNELQNGIKIEY